MPYRIALVAPLYESVPPQGYGGTERVVAYLAEELVRAGHDVTLFASGDSQSSARLVPTTALALRPFLSPTDMQELSLPLHLAMLSNVLQRAQDFDVVHCHVDYLSLAFAPFVPTPMVATMHGQLDLPHLRPFCRRFPHANLVSISHHQRTPLADLPLNWAATVYNGVPVEAFPFEAKTGEYLLFVGRLSPEKRVDWAVEIARRVGMPLKIAAKINVWERAYYEEVLRPLFDDPLVEFIGEVDEEAKRALMAGAYALVFPIDWPEPFGMVMIEALACGTPVLALDRGAVSEVLCHGVTGFIGTSVDDLVAAVPRVALLDRAECRAYVARRFSAQAMASGYAQVYAQLIAQRHARLQASPTCYTHEQRHSFTASSLPRAGRGK